MMLRLEINVFEEIMLIQYQLVNVSYIICNTFLNKIGKKLVIIFTLHEKVLVKIYSCNNYGFTKFYLWIQKENIYWKIYSKILSPLFVIIIPLKI